MRAARWASLPGFGHTVDEACRKFGISAYALRKARKELGPILLTWSDEDFILASMHPGGPVHVQGMMFYYDWINHAGVTRKQVLSILRKLAARGMVRRISRDWFELTCEWP